MLLEIRNLISVIQNMVRKADDVDFFDKLLRDHMITILKNERKEQEDFLETIETVRNQINEHLKYSQNREFLFDERANN